MKTDVFPSEPGVAPKFDLYQDVTNKIIGMIENGVVPWRKPWNSYGLARNYISGHIYTGINYILMNNTSHKIPYFLTYNQIQNLGGSLKEGVRAEKVVYFDVKYKDENGQYLDSDQAKELIIQGKVLKFSRHIKYFKVFGIEDVEGIELDIKMSNFFPNEKIELCEAIIENTVNMPEILNIDCNSAYYSADSDSINMPKMNNFNSSEFYYATLFHELIHSTGHATRLGREEVINGSKFGSDSYSTEEIVAEMGASYLCAIVHIDYEQIVENNAAYLDGWLKVLKEDSKFIFKAAAESQKAVDYILNSKVN